MNAPAFETVRFFRRIVLFFPACLLWFCGSACAQKKAPPPLPPSAPVVKSEIRTITAFINLDRADYQQQIADTVKMLKYARTVFESRGFTVQSIRIATQPFTEYTKGLTNEQIIAFFKEYDALSLKEGFRAAIGPAMWNAPDDDAQADLLGEILKNTKNLNGSVIVANDDGINWKAVGAAARVMRYLADNSDRGMRNFGFAAIAMVPSLEPFFPVSYHTGFGHQFTIGLQSTDVVAAAFQNAPDLATAKQRLVDMLGSDAAAIEDLADRVDRDMGWTYMGIDLTPAPRGDHSIGAAIENLTAQPIGASGTLTAAATITSAVKSIPVKQAGYEGLMLPILEDSRLAQRWSEGRLHLDSLLAYSAVCGTGLDAVPLPGDVTVEQMSLIIGDMASLAYKWHKPLTVRLLPIPGGKPGNLVDFHDPLYNATTLQPLPEFEMKP